MSEFYTVKHSYNSGDLIVLLSGLNHLHKKTGKKFIIYQNLNFPAYFYDVNNNIINNIHPVKDKHDNIVCMNQEMWLMLKPLLENQDYIEKFEVWEGQEVDYDIDLTRDSKIIPMPAGLIHHYAWSLYPEMSCDLGNRWIDSWPFGFANTNKGQINLLNKIIINRTARYQNPYITYFFIKKHQERIIFAGLEEEYTNFCSTWDLDIPLLIVEDFYELARIISSCDGFIGNQSFCWHLADAQKVPRILELCTQFPNTFPTGEGGYAFYKQKALEFYFNKLINLSKSVTI